MSLESKFTCIIILLCSFLLILATGRVNIRNFEEVQHSIEEIYSDRLVVKGLIFELSALLHKKELSLVFDKEKNNMQNELINAQIAKNLQEFRTTQLTSNEEKTLDRFSKGVKFLQAVEKEVDLSNRENLDKIQINQLSDKIQSLQKDLKTLSGIQLSEGKHKMNVSNAAVVKMYKFERIENYALLILGVMMLFFVFIPRPKPK